MSKRILVVFLALTLPALAFAETVRIGVIGTTDVGYPPTLGTTFLPLSDAPDTMYGLYWEAISGRFGFGMTYQIATAQLAVDDWYLDWNGSVDFRFHAFKRFFIDPFVEASFGSAGRTEFVTQTVVGKGTETQTTGQVLAMSVYGQIGAGIAFRFRPFHIGIKADYRYSNQPVMLTGYPAYPMKAFSAGVFGGLSF